MINLTTKLKAYPRIAPSILDNYYKKDELYNKEEIDDKLEGYVKEIDNPEAGVIYGRGLVDGNPGWIGLEDTSLLILGNIINKNSITSEDVLDMTPALLSGDLEYATFSINPINNGYLWICSTKEITQVEFISNINAFNVIENIIEKDPIIASVNNIERKFYCYKTITKYVALGDQLQWKITF